MKLLAARRGGRCRDARFLALLPVAGAVSFPETLAAARSAGEREAVLAARGSGLRAGQFTGAVTIVAGGLVSAWLLRRASERS